MISSQDISVVLRQIQILDKRKRTYHSADAKNRNPNAYPLSVHDTQNTNLSLSLIAVQDTSPADADKGDKELH